MSAHPVYASEIMSESLLILIIVTLALAGFLAWALVGGLGNPRPQVEVEDGLDALRRMGIEVRISPYVPAGTALIIPILFEQRIGMSVMRPGDAVKITGIGS